MRWYLSLTAALLPVMVAGFVASALANRLLFVAWSLIAAAGAAALLHRGFAAGWPGPVLCAAVLAWLALAAAAFGVLGARYQEPFDLGFRALLPGLYHPLWTHPGSSYALALALAGIGLARWLVHRWRTR